MWELIPSSFIYGVAKDIWFAIRGRRRRLTPMQALALHQRWKKEVEEKLVELRAADNYGVEGIIRNVERRTEYPDVKDSEKGISPWFRVGLMGTYHRGIKVGLQWRELVFDKRLEKLRYADYKRGEKGEVKVILMGYIPYENIEAIDWNGDEYYGGPHIYCYFDARKNEPYEKLCFCQPQDLGNGFRYFMEVADYDHTRKISKKVGLS